MRQALSLLATLCILTGALPRSVVASCAGGDSANEPTVDGRGLALLDQSLRELNNPFTVVSVAARPDDVDYGTLAYYHKKLGARVVILLATRAEGRQLWIEHNLDEDPGVTRTRETLDAARVVGADVYFLNLRDFGESQSVEETFSIWGHDEALQRLVRAIRSLRPDVIITNHDSEAGDGQDQALARLDLEAFEAAADPKRFVGNDSQPWQVRRIFQRSDISTVGVLVDLTEYDHVHGSTYAQMAITAYGQLASLGYGAHRDAPNTEKIYYKLLRSASDEKFVFGKTLFEGLKLPDNIAHAILPPHVGDMTSLEAIGLDERLIEALKEKLIEKRAEGSPSDIYNRYGEEFFRMIRYIEELERALALALGISFEITVSDLTLVPGQKFTARLNMRNSSEQSLPVIFHAAESFPASQQKPSFKPSDVIRVAPQTSVTKEIEYEVPKDASLSVPDSDHLYEENYYPVASALPGSQPASAFGARLIAFAEVSLGQTTLTLPALARCEIVPAVEISTIPFALIKDWAETRDFEFIARVRNRTPGELAGALWVVPLAITEDSYEPVHIRFTEEDEEIAVKLRLRLPILKPPLAPDLLFEFRREKPAPPDALGSAKIPVRAIDSRIAENLRVGYIRGFDRWLDLALTELGIEHEELTIDEIKTFEHGNGDQTAGQINSKCAGLARFDTVIIDERAYTAWPRLATINECLLDYAKHGGNVIMLSQQPKDWNLVFEKRPAAPFLIRLSDNPIVVETAPVKLLVEDHPLFDKPNKISAGDFEGWVADRATNLPGAWASEYVSLLESNDPGDDPQRGGLLFARFGEGTYVFTSFDWRRQALAGKAGAYRVLANLIAAGKTMKEQ